MEEKVLMEPIIGENIYRVAWRTLLKRVETKTSWGKIELKSLMLDCFVNPEEEKKVG